MSLQRLYRLRDAPKYVGMNKNRFNTEVRPYLTEIPIGKQGIAFDRLELDHWVDQYSKRYGVPSVHLRGEPLWDDKRRRQDYGNVEKSGTLKSKSEGMERFENLVKQVISQKRKHT